MRSMRALAKAKPDLASHQRWITFLRNHEDLIALSELREKPKALSQKLQARAKTEAMLPPERSKPKPGPKSVIASQNE
jgi:hypothetical protein